jgi:hypothetical protein
MPKVGSKGGDEAVLKLQARKVGLEIPEERLPHVLATANWLSDCVAALRKFVASRDLP